MKISVIIPVYNEENDLNECIDSLVNQSEESFEIIVIDDGSTDNTLNVVKEFERIKSPDIKIISQKHKGAGAARNLGAKTARGDILVFIDADMTFEKSFLSKLTRPIIENEAIGTFSKEEFLQNKDNIWAICWNLNRGLPKDRMHGKDYPARQKVFRAIKKEKFIEAGGFYEKAGYTDDWTLAEKLGEDATAVPGAIFYHRNPGTLKEVFRQSRWMSKRKYKFGFFGVVYSLIKYSLPFSLIFGFYESFAFHLLPFTLFKVISDFGQFIGILEYNLGKVAK